MSARIRIIVVAFDSEGFLQPCLDALAAQDFADFEVVVVDNGGTARGPHAPRLPDARFTQLVSPDNDGFGGGFVRGADGASGEFLMSVNPDTVLDPDCLTRLIAASEANGAPAMLSPVLFSDARRTTYDGLGDSLSVFGIPWRNGHGRAAGTAPDRALSEVFAPTGAAALYRRDAYRAAGGFDPAFFCYLEDVDLGLRIRGQGGRCLLVHGATGVHTGGHSTGKIGGFALRYTARNAPLLILGSLPVLLRGPVWALYRVGQRRLQRRGLGSASAADREAAHYRADGLAEANAMIALAKAKRRNRPPYPWGASWRIARRLDWGLDGLRRHAIRTWPWYP